MATTVVKNGTLNLTRWEGTSSGALKSYISWNTTLINGNEYALNFEFYAAVDTTVTRNCWYYITVGGYNNSSDISGSIKISSSGYNLIDSGSITIEVGDSGKWSGEIHALIGFDRDDGSQKAAEGTWSSIQAAPANYKVYYHINDGSGNVYKIASGLDYGDTHTVISTKPTHSGKTSRQENFTITGKANGGNKDLSVTATKNISISYTFLGWATSSTATTATYSANDQFNITKSIKLYAVWKVTETISGYKNNSLNDLGTPTKSAEGTLYNLTLVPNNDGENIIIEAGKLTQYDFLGWGSTSSSTAVLSSTKTYKSTTTVYAIWRSTVIDKSTVDLSIPNKSPSVIQEYSITLDPNGGNVAPKSITANRSISYLFKGWSTVNGDSSRIVENPYTPNGTIELYGIWDSLETTESVKLPIPIMADYKFLGWTANKNSDKYVDMAYTPIQDITLYAIYKSIYMAEIYIWHNNEWHKAVPYLHHQDIFNECINAT